MTNVELVGTSVLAVLAMEGEMERGRFSFVVPWVIWLLLFTPLGGCYRQPQHVIGRWDRIIAGPAWVPAGTLDRSTFYYEGAVVQERGGQVRRGSWDEDWAGAVTLRFGTDVAVWQATKPTCPDRPGECLVLTRPEVIDWYAPGY